MQVLCKLDDRVSKWARLGSFLFINFLAMGTYICECSFNQCCSICHQPCLPFSFSFFFCDWLRHLSLNLWTVLSRSHHFWFWNLFKIRRESKVVVRLGSFLPLILLGKGTNIGDRECGSYHSLSVLCIYCVLILYLFHLLPLVYGSG